MFSNSHLVDEAREEVRYSCDPFVRVDNAQFIWHRRDGKSAGLVVSPLASQSKRLQTLSCSTGADTAGWLTENNFNPLTVFGNLTSERWLNTHEYVSMFAEFAKIDACDWARLMVQGMASSVGAFHDEDERSPFDELSNIGVVERFRNTILDRLQIMEREIVPDLGDL
jgi:hypothetical protein